MKEMEFDVSLKKMFMIAKHSMNDRKDVMGIIVGPNRGVKLLEHGMKVVERIFERSLRNLVTVNEMQCGFILGKGTVDALFMARMWQESLGRRNGGCSCVLYIWRRPLLIEYRGRSLSGRSV